MRGANDALETINAAASAIASAENRVPQASLQKRRWGSRFSKYWCFGYQKHNKRIGHASLVPEPITGEEEFGTAPAAAENRQVAARSIALPFVAPPSSPASFLQSEPPSATQSPTGLLSLTSISANIYSPGGPHSIFAIGPYAHETQLVSPPVFSTFTTEPSTAPFTPPPESVHLTTPSSPEVPFARLLDPNYPNGETGHRFPISSYDFQSYQFYPGSPVGHLISPGSGFSGSGTSSPFPDGPPKVLNLDKLWPYEWRVEPASRDPDCPNPNDLATHRVSFEITGERVVRGRDDVADGHDDMAEGAANVDGKSLHRRNRSPTLGSVKEFKFDNVEGGSSDKPGIGPDWWANETIPVPIEGGPCKNWAFPVLQPGVS